MVEPHEGPQIGGDREGHVYNALQLIRSGLQPVGQNLDRKSLSSLRRSKAADHPPQVASRQRLAPRAEGYEGKLLLRDQRALDGTHQEIGSCFVGSCTQYDGNAQRSLPTSHEPLEHAIQPSLAATPGLAQEVPNLKPGVGPARLRDYGTQELTFRIQSPELRAELEG